jgi:hypothetical protein
MSSAPKVEMIKLNMELPPEFGRPPSLQLRA